MHHHIDMVTHTMAFVKPVMVPLVETEDGTNEGGSAGDRTGDRTGDLSHRMQEPYRCTTPRPLRLRVVLQYEIELMIMCGLVRLQSRSSTMPVNG